MPEELRPVRGRAAWKAVAIVLVAGSLQAQESRGVFGSETRVASAFEGRVFRLPANTRSLPDFNRLRPVRTIYADSLDVPSRSWSAGFPGYPDLIEWFAIQYTGMFVCRNPGQYSFRLVSDDGSKLFMDGSVLIDNDGLHSPATKQSKQTTIDGASHTMVLQYFQGPRHHIALQLFYTRETGREQIFPGTDFALSTPEAVAGPVTGSGKLRARGDASGGAVSPLPTVLPAVELILDSSGSMADLIADRSKMSIAQAVVERLLDGLPEGTEVGLRLFGYWGVLRSQRTEPKAQPLRTDDPQLDVDSDLVVPIARLSQHHRADLQKWVAGAKPRGKTPLVFSLLEARKDFGGILDKPKTIVLVSDGVDTCGGKLADVEAAYRRGGMELIIHVVGFDVRDASEEQQLRSLASAGGGGYFSAKNADGLASAISSAISATEFVVYSSDRSSIVAVGVVNGETLTLPAGEYFVGVNRGSPTERKRIRIDDASDIVLSFVNETAFVIEEY
jgi:PA14 domain/von Willebrand factor type A domain